MYGDRAHQTTTTTGAGTVTLISPATGEQAISAIAQVGDPVPYTILDANGTDWETGLAPLGSSSTLTRGPLRSTNSNAAISLSSGTHQVFVNLTADEALRMAAASDFFIDHVASGLVVPTSVSLSATMSAGVAYVLGRRVVKGAQAHTYTASRDTYIDLSIDGVLTYSPVTNGSSAPTLTANSIRIAKVITSGSAVTSGGDVANRISVPFCDISDTGAKTLIDATWTLFTFDTNLLDNTGGSMHSTSSNQSRIVVPNDGLYVAQGSYNIILSSATYSLVGFSTNNAGSMNSNAGQVGALLGSGYGQAWYCMTSIPMPLRAGDYFEMFGYQGGASSDIPIITGSAQMSVRRVA